MVKVWNWATDTCATVALYDNSDGSFGWRSDHLNIKAFSLNKVLKIRFLATGQKSSEISAWYIDNIAIYRNCFGVEELNLDEYENQNELLWVGPDWCWPEIWLHWDDGPPKDGYGNMIYFNSTWSTLLEINPDLDYNWNIAVNLAYPSSADHPRIRSNIYRQVNSEDFVLYDTTLSQEYIDSNIFLTIIIDMPLLYFTLRHPTRVNQTCRNRFAKALTLEWLMLS